MLLGLNYQYRNTIIVNIIDNTVMSRDVTGIGYKVTANQSFWMS